PVPLGPTAFPGLFAPPEVAGTLAVAAESGAPARDAAREIAETIARGWPGFRTIPLEGQPNVGDCAHKSYVAALRVSAARDGGGAAGYPQVGLALSDCGGWPVAQWYVDASCGWREGALAALRRMRVWMLEAPQRADELLTSGLALAPGDPPTYLYALYKSNDGNVRAYVRPAGPAFLDGLRTGDIVERVDGLFWWEYGTYRTELFPYDGAPHEFEVRRDGRTLDIRLGAALALPATAPAAARAAP
ncbi:MAG: hypothetical protein ACREM2_10440, partial [Vulcanimicrobiaceae bacterium]